MQGDEFVCELYEIVSLFYLPKKLVCSTTPYIDALELINRSWLVFSPYILCC